MTTLLAPSLRAARKAGNVEELAGALRAYAEKLAPNHSNAVVNVIHPTAKAEVDELAVAPEVVEAPPEPGPQASPRDFRDVMRDVQPAAGDHDDDLPAEERVALHEDQAALQRHRDVPKESPPRATSSAPEPKRASPPSEGQWMVGEVAYINHYTQCGRVHLPDFGDIQFSDKTPRAAGLKLQQGLEVDCRFVMRHGRPWVIEFAKAQVVA